MTEYRTTDNDQLVLASVSSIEQGFRKFHRENPWVYDRLVELARLWKLRRPDSRLGIKMLFERLRWDLAIRTTGEPLKLNNNYHSYYSRLMMEREPDLADLFETRRLRAREPDLNGS